MRYFFFILLAVNISPCFSQGWTELNDSLIYYYDNNELKKAAVIGEKAILVAKKEYGEAHENYATGISNLASVYKKMEDYENAEILLLRAFDIRKTVLDKAHPDYLRSLTDLASLYRKIENFQKAKTYCLLLAEHYLLSKGSKSPDYARQLNSLGLIYYALDSLAATEQYYKGAYEILKNTQTDEELLEAVMYNLANFYNNKGFPDKAELLFVELLSLQKKLFGVSNQDYITTAESLAYIFRRNLKYKESELLRKQALSYYKPRSSDSLRYGRAVYNLAVLYHDMGYYTSAEQLFLESIELNLKFYGEKSLEYASDLYSLGALYKDIGQYEKAAVLLVQAKDIRKQLLGENHPAYGACLNDLATLSLDLGLYELAESYFKETERIWKIAYGEEHPYYAILLHNMAVVYHRTGKYDQAEQFYLKGKEIRQRTVGENHPDYANSLDNLATLYLDKGMYNEAEPYSLQAMEIQKKVYGENHPLYTMAMNNLAYIYEAGEKYTKAELLFAEYQKIEIQNLISVFGAMSEKEKENYLSNKLYLNNNSNNLVYNYRLARPAFYQGNFNLQLFLKSLLLSSTQKTLQAVRSSKDTVVQQTFSHWQNNKSSLAKQYTLPISERSENLKQLEKETENLEKELVQKSAAFRKEQQGLQIKYSDVQKNLQQNEVAIEFVRFQLYNKRWTDTMVYAAYILSKNDSIPIFVPLCEEKQLQKIFDSAGTTATAMVSKFYRGLEVKNKNTAGALGTELYKLIWQPLEPYLKNVKKVSYSPAGKLYSIAFHALPVDTTMVLMDKYQLQQYTSTRQVVLRNSETKIVKPASITLFGNASFTMDSLQLAKQKSNQPTAGSIYTPPTRGNNNSTWSDLPGTAQEVSTIKRVFEENKVSTKSFTQISASEENLKAVSGNSPQILHIATHGFFLSEPDKKRKENNIDNENTYTLAEDPLLRSGLILSGGNYAWSGKAPIDGVEDGIVTAYEISQLNLSNTELVVLSACETALGDVKGSEGVFGLQRAFKMTGVKKMIVSLWQVPDKETAELMTAFYSYWMKGKTISDAFAQAQADMRKKYSPFYWAAFVLVE